QLHHAVFQSGKRSLALDLSDGLTVAISGLRVVNPQLAGQIPPDVKTGLIKIGQGSYAADLAQTLDTLHTLLLALGVGGVVLLAAAASATLRAAGARAQLESLRRLVTRLPASRWARAGYAALAVALGVALLLVPNVTLTLLVRAAGLVVLYLAGSELLR